MTSEVQVEAGDSQLPAVEPVAPAPTLGQRLRSERERQGLSIPDVAQRLKYAPRQIEAIEADDFNALPGLTFVRGFVRGYARLLGTDGDALVRALEISAEQDNGPTTVQLQGVSGTREQFPTGGSSHKSVLPWLLAILLVVGGLGGYSVYNWQAPKEFLPSESVKQPAPAASATPASQAMLPEQQPGGSAQQSLGLPADAPTAGAVAMSEPVAASKSDSLTAPPAGMARIRLVFSGESWTELRDGGGNVLLSRRNAAGSEQTAEGTPPFDVVVGNARDVKLFYNGAEVDMTPYTKVSVAKFQLK
jgi:cytoskeleton protein RodZ